MTLYVALLYAMIMLQNAQVELEFMSVTVLVTQLNVTLDITLMVLIVKVNYLVYGYILLGSAQIEYDKNWLNWHFVYLYKLLSNSIFRQTCYDNFIVCPGFGTYTCNNNANPTKCRAGYYLEDVGGEDVVCKSNFLFVYYLLKWLFSAYQLLNLCYNNFSECPGKCP